MQTPILTPEMTSYHKSHLVADRVTEISETLTRAFKRLRQETGNQTVARKNFCCCNSCAGYQIGEMVTKRITKGKVLTGAVWYNRQGHASLMEGHDLYISYDGFQPSPEEKGGYKSSTEDTIRLGKALKAALEAEGLTVEWDGNPSQCIMVPVWPETRELFPEGTEVIVPVLGGKTQSGQVVNHFGRNLKVEYPDGATQVVRYDRVTKAA